MAANNYARRKQTENHHREIKYYVAGIDDPALKALKMSHDAYGRNCFDQSWVVGELFEQFGDRGPSGENQKETNHH